MDTEWNSILVEKGIIKAPERVKEENGADGGTPASIEGSIAEDIFDDEDEEVLRKYRMNRINEMKKNAAKKRFCEVKEITRIDYIDEVNKAGDGVYVVLHIYKPGIPLCSLLNNFFNQLALKFSTTKFLKSISSLCIENFPDENLPSIFVYCDGQLKKQLIGASTFGGLDLKIDELEWMLSKTGAIESDLKSNPRVAREKSQKTMMKFDESDDE